MADLISPADLPSLLLTVPAWTHENKGLERTWTFKNFAGSLAFVNLVGALAEASDHHPDIDIRWNKVRLFLSTHSRGGLTSLDFEMAKKIDAA